MTTIFVVDGHNLLWRAHHGFPARITNRAGQDCTSAFGFFALLRKTMAELFIELECVVCFDGATGTKNRKDLYAGYKAHRGPDVAPLALLPEVKRGLDIIGIQWLELENSEADDVIATVASKDPRRSAIVFSTDKDFYQLLRPNISIFRGGRRRTKELLFNEQQLREDYLVEADQWCDFRALVGDPADNIPGIVGLGPVRAAALLQNGKHLEDLLDDISNPRLVQLLRGGGDLLANRALLTLSRHEDVVLDLSDRPSARIPIARDLLRTIGLM